MFKIKWVLNNYNTNHTWMFAHPHPQFKQIKPFQFEPIVDNSEIKLSKYLIEYKPQFNFELYWNEDFEKRESIVEKFT